MEKAFLKAIALLQKLKKFKLIKGFALSGGVAVSFYVSYRTTFDIDFVIDVSPEDMHKIYEWLKFNGYRVKMDREVPMISVEIEKVPVELLPAKGFLKEGIKRAKEVVLKNIRIPLLRPEYLIISKLERGEEQDLLDVEVLKREATVSEKALKKLKKKIKKI